MLCRCVLSRSAHVSINIACLNRFDLHSATGNPPKLATPLVGVRRFCDWKEEKKSAPTDSGDAPVVRGDGATGRQSSSARGCAKACSYMSRSQLQCVGKMPNKPGKTNGVDHGPAHPRRKIDRFTPGITSGSELKS